MSSENAILGITSMYIKHHVISERKKIEEEHLLRGEINNYLHVKKLYLPNNE